MDPLDVSVRGDTVTVAVRVQPRASRNAIGGVHEGALKIAVTAPPVEGEANAAVIALVAKALGLPKRAVVVSLGETSRRKVLEITGATLEAVRALAGA